MSEKEMLELSFEDIEIEKDLEQTAEGCCEAAEPSAEPEEEIAEESGQLTLFGALEGVKPANAKKPAKQPASTDKKEDDKDKPIGKPVVVCYAGQKIPVTDPSLTLEQIRARLQKDFPELTKDNTDMQFDEKNSIVRVYPIGKKRG